MLRAEALTKEKLMQNIGISGYARSGKDSVAAILVEEYGYTRVAFADALRDALYVLNPVVGVDTACGGYSRLQEIVDGNGWEAAKTQSGLGSDETRRLLQVLGTDVVRNMFGENAWVDIAMRKACEIEGPVVFTDMRFASEYGAIIAGGGHAWRIVRQGTPPATSHVSETALDEYDFDVRIRNNGTLDSLAGVVRSIMRDYQ
jgi:hypothetical protein